MRVTLHNSSCVVTREPGDPRLKTDSQLLYHVKNALNHQSPNPRQWIKKLIVKDGHLTDERRHYLRTRAGDVAIYDPDYQIRGLLEEYRTQGSISLEVVR